MLGTYSFTLVALLEVKLLLLTKNDFDSKALLESNHCVISLGTHLLMKMVVLVCLCQSVYFGWSKDWNSALSLTVVA
jgi:hypothetical protein